MIQGEMHPMRFDEVDKDVKNLPWKATGMHELLLSLGFILVLDFKQ